ncbi:[protein-PII] uridylyltransferase [Pseudidiomarina taiwanensis]|uniref:Bifunctional uridylyltransferase/uridylyl-removing enzyme n=1 Tax=Pseudidiomarina taiwanensis TaxID=337250 RepID=A0A432ZNP3_9GAMM|nr:[protein-PII] uridylyltransferase [Pseudidiomarina taiwanensis]RUO79493.1 [protein-PII] uridylyltransferase [Pseudidiomarina taiwanensis]
MTQTAAPNWQFPASIAQLREQLKDYQDWSAGAFVTADIESLLTHRSDFIDQLLQHLFSEYGLAQQQVALIAVGGYGRGTLHPHSDIDLLFLVPRTPPTPELGRLLEQFMQVLWDLKFEVGHSVRSVRDCLNQAQADVTVATSLLEHRLICGDHNIAEQLSQTLRNEFPWSSRAYYQAKSAEQLARHHRFHGTSYNLEPNIKSSPGGLRDIQTISWIAKRHFATQSDESLVLYGFISAEELLELREQQLFLWRLRYALHIEAGKAEDRLLFDFQMGVAERLGYGQGKAAVEAMMKDYFNAVAAVRELNSMLLQYFEQEILTPVNSQPVTPLSEDFWLREQTIGASHDHVFEQPVQLLKFVVLIAENSQITTIQADTIRLLRNARRGLLHPLSHDPNCRRWFLTWLRHPNAMGFAFEVMHTHRILAHYLPAWQQIVGQMQFDLFHAYTVDEHTFRLVKNLAAYAEPATIEEFPLCAELFQQMDKPELLFLAGIFHDIAKGRGGDHSELGEQDVRNFGLAHELAQDDIDLVAFLVRHHLLMSVTAQKQDIHDPEVIKMFAEKVNNQRQLAYLYCLTVADIRATNSRLWNNWKASLLENLYQLTAQYLDKEVSTTQHLREQIQANKNHAMALLLSAGYHVSSIEQLWSRFTADYFFRHQAEQIAWHSQHILDVENDAELPLILVGDEKNQGATELFLYDQEQTHLFAAVCAVIDSQNLSIHDAQILATRDGFVMDTFVILQADSKPLTEATQIEALKQRLHDVLRGRSQAPITRRRLPRQLRNFTVRTKVNFVAHAQRGRTTLELIALDRPGLVAQVARVLQEFELNILAAKITTVGEQAEDFFVLTTPQQQALDADLQEQLAARLKQAIKGQE